MKRMTIATTNLVPLQIGDFSCQCPPGYVGKRCEGDVNECLSNPCSELGTQSCVPLDNDFRCVAMKLCFTEQIRTTVSSNYEGLQILTLLSL